MDVIDGLIDACDNRSFAASVRGDDSTKLIKVNSKGDAEPAHQAAIQATSQLGVKTSFQIRFVPSTNCFESGTDPLLVVREVKSLGTITKSIVDSSRLPALPDRHPEPCYLSWLIELESDCGKQAVEDVGMFLDGESKFEVTKLEPVPPQVELPTPRATSQLQRKL